MLTANAQNTAATRKQVAEIRKIYAQTKESLQFRKDAELPPDEMVVSNDYMAAGAGPIKDTYHYFFSGDYNEDFGGEVYTVHFITRNHNIGAIDFYEEYLFNEEGSLVFYYEKTGQDETRYYFDEGRLIHSIITGKESNWKEIDADLTMLHRFAADTMGAFNLLMNRSY